MRMLWRLLCIWVASAWQTRVGVDDTVTVQRRVGLFDLDLNLHMNHARFLTVVEEVLLEGLQRSGFLRSILGAGAVPMVGGSLISYRRELKAFQSYRVALRYLGADARWHVFEYAFLNRSGQLVALGYVKGGAVGRRRLVRGLVPSQTLWDAHKSRHPGLRDQPGVPTAALGWLAAEREAFDRHRA